MSGGQAALLGPKANCRSVRRVRNRRRDTGWAGCHVVAFRHGS